MIEWLGEPLIVTRFMFIWIWAAIMMLFIIGGIERGER